MTVDKRVAVIMGGGADIGRVICRAMAEKGFQLALNDIDEARAKQCSDSLAEIGPPPLIITGDICKKGEVGRIRDEVENKFGRADILINVQGVLHNELMLKLTEDGWRKTLNVHVDGTLNSMQAFAPMMIEKNYGRIVNMSSIGVRGSLAGASYGAAKGAVEALSRTAALEWARYGITVNCVAPGLIKAGMFLTTPEHYQRAGIEKTPMKRAGEPEEVAACVRFLASEEASFITGQTIFVCGGLSIGF
jgi:3-oxoacyl-[acyl-carrier protein] reductase